jgi:hypothetical protein
MVEHLINIPQKSLQSVHLIKNLIQTDKNKGIFCSKTFTINIIIVPKSFILSMDNIEEVVSLKINNNVFLLPLETL